MKFSLLVIGLLSAGALAGSAAPQAACADNQFDNAANALGAGTVDRNRDTRDGSSYFTVKATSTSTLGLADSISSSASSSNRITNYNRGRDASEGVKTIEYNPVLSHVQPDRTVRIANFIDLQASQRTSMPPQISGSVNTQQESQQQQLVLKTNDVVQNVVIPVAAPTTVISPIATATQSSDSACVVDAKQTQSVSSQVITHQTPAIKPVVTQTQQDQTSQQFEQFRSQQRQAQIQQQIQAQVQQQLEQQRLRVYLAQQQAEQQRLEKQKIQQQVDQTAQLQQRSFSQYAQQQKNILQATVSTQSKQLADSLLAQQQSQIILQPAQIVEQVVVPQAIVQPQFVYAVYDQDSGNALQLDQPLQQNQNAVTASSIISDPSSNIVISPSKGNLVTVQDCMGTAVPMGKIDDLQLKNFIQRNFQDNNAPQGLPRAPDYKLKIRLNKPPHFVQQTPKPADAGCT